MCTEACPPSAAGLQQPSDNNGHRRYQCGSQSPDRLCPHQNGLWRITVAGLSCQPSERHCSSAPINPPLPWLWLASLAGDAYSQEAFELWWQLHVLGQPYPPMLCPWCDPRPELSSTHLRTECSTFATACWIRGIQPEEAFLYPSGPAWFQAALLAVHEIQRAADGL